MDGTVDERSAKERRSMSEQVILVDVADRVAVVTHNRPESRNALNPALNAAIQEAIAGCDKRDDVDVIVLTGADPAFCAGVDLKELTTDSEVKHIVSDEHELIRPFPETAKPVIGAINGAAVTGGFEVALTCDFLVASERARFADTHARVGNMPGGGITVLLARWIGLPRAIEMSLTGNFVPADEALRLGLVNHVVPHDELLPFARGLAADIVSNDQTGVRRLLAHYRRIANAATHDEAHLIEGYMAEQWTRDASALAGRRQAVTERGRAQGV
jgi:enoyl-CoA hydratase